MSLLSAPLLLLVMLPALFANPCVQPLVDERWQPKIYNHILEADGGYEVLVPETDGAYHVSKVASMREATLLLRNVGEPLDPEAIIEAKRPQLAELLLLLRKFKSANPDLAISSRMKEPESLRRKIFEKVKKRGPEFRLSDVDDVIGARIAVPTTADVALTAERLRGIKGLTVLKFDPIRYDRGYRATHVTVKTAAGAVFEIQIMTRRMLAWVTWNAKRVYKPLGTTRTAYFAELEAYNTEVIRYLNALDEGVTPPAPPDSAAHGVMPEDVFVLDQLR